MIKKDYNEFMEEFQENPIDFLTLMMRDLFDRVSYIEDKLQKMQSIDYDTYHTLRIQYNEKFHEEHKVN